MLIDPGTPYSRKTAAPRIGVSPRKLDQLIAERKIAHARIDKRIVITEAAIREFLDAHTVDAFDAKEVARNIITRKKRG